MSFLAHSIAEANPPRALAPDAPHLEDGNNEEGSVVSNGTFTEGRNSPTRPGCTRWVSDSAGQCWESGGSERANTLGHVDRPAGTAPSIYVRRVCLVDRGAGRDVCHDHVRGYLSVHQHSRHNSDLDLFRTVPDRNGGPDHYRERESFHYHSERHRAHRIRVAPRAGGHAALLSSQCSDRCRACTGDRSGA